MYLPETWSLAKDGNLELGGYAGFSLAAAGRLHSPCSLHGRARDFFSKNGQRTRGCSPSRACLRRSSLKPWGGAGSPAGAAAPTCAHPANELCSV